MEIVHFITQDTKPMLRQKSMRVKNISGFARHGMKTPSKTSNGFNKETIPLASEKLCSLPRNGTDR
jgi:hypothetical protein